MIKPIFCMLTMLKGVCTCIFCYIYSLLVMPISTCKIASESEWRFLIGWKQGRESGEVDQGLSPQGGGGGGGGWLFLSVCACMYVFVCLFKGLCVRVYVCVCVCVVLICVCVCVCLPAVGSMPYLLILLDAFHWLSFTNPTISLSLLILSLS